MRVITVNNDISSLRIWLPRRDCFASSHPRTFERGCLCHLVENAPQSRAACTWVRATTATVHSRMAVGAYQWRARRRIEDAPGGVNKRRHAPEGCLYLSKGSWVFVRAELGPHHVMVHFRWQVRVRSPRVQCRHEALLNKVGMADVAALHAAQVHGLPRLRPNAAGQLVQHRCVPSPPFSLSCSRRVRR